MIEVEEIKNLYRDEFETVFGVKKNIQALRDKVLDLAFRGMLVEQNPDDGTGQELYKEIQKKKKELVKEKKVKNIKSYPSIGSEDFLYEIPDNWMWVRLGEIGNVIGGGTPKTSEPKYWKDGDIPWVSPVDLSGYKNKFISNGRKYITGLGLEKSSAQLLAEGSVLFSSRAPIGYVAIAGNPIATNQGFKSISPYIRELNDYIYHYFFAFIEDIKSRSSGTTFKEISGSELGKSMLPLPPLQEQKRIVSKIEELMNQIDQLEEQLEEKEKLETLIPKAVVTALSNSQDEEKLKKNLALVIENFTEVFQTPESLEEFRGVILQLGVQGKLLPQNMKDEPVEKLLEEIQTTKGKKLQTINTKEAPHFIPDTWAWIKFGDLVDFNMGKTAPRNDASYWKDGIYNWVSIADMDDGKHLQNTKEKVTEKAKINIFKEKIAPKGTLLMSFKLTIGKMAILDMEAFHNEAIISIYPNNKEPKVIRDYLFRIGKGLDMLKGSKNAIKGATLNKTSLNNILVPLPPLEEQKRIVAKIESIFAVVDQLEEEMKRRDRIVETMAII